MRIVSKFHDYYDGVAKQFQDSSIVYVRENKFLEVKSYGLKDYKFPWRETSASSKSWSFHGRLLGVAGKIYPVILIKRRDYSAPITSYIKDFVAWSWDECASFLNQVNCDDYRLKQLQKELKSFFLADFSRMEQLFHDHKVPCWALYREGYSDMFDETQVPIFKLELNPALQPYGFFRILDAFQTFQEISMFVGGVLSNTEDKIPKVDDQIRFEGKGFDKKTSFRNSK